jgi:hypothetical protein
MSSQPPRKAKITRRKPGLVITPPAARPVQNDHPARLIFQEVLAAERAAAIRDDIHAGEDLGTPLNDQPDPNLEAAVTHSSKSSEAEEIAASPSDNVVRASTLDVSDRQPGPAKASMAVVAASHVTMSSLPGRGDSGELDGRLGVTERADFSPTIEVLSWDEFERTFKKRLSKSQLKVCRVLYEKTYALGLESCLIRTRDLMEMSKVRGRTMYYALSELESAGFISRGVIYNTPTKRGQVISFYPNPKLSRMGDGRRFHYYDQVE